MSKIDRAQSPDKPFIAPGAQLSGRISLNSGTSIWYNAVLRGDGPITVGENSNIQDLTMIHCDPDKSLHIGDYVTIGHQAIIHNLQIGNNSLIGMGAILLDDVVVGENCIVGAGSLVTQGTRIPDGEVWFGSPAKFKRNISPQEIESNRQSAIHYVQTAKEHANEL